MRWGILRSVSISRATLGDPDLASRRKATWLGIARAIIYLAFGTSYLPVGEDQRPRRTASESVTETD
jgi:hypothetical protein